jgi:hypothetical protein
MYKFQPNTSTDPLEWYWFKNGFSNEEVDQIVAESTNWGLTTAGVTGSFTTIGAVTVRIVCSTANSYWYFMSNTGQWTAA